MNSNDFTESYLSLFLLFAIFSVIMFRIVRNHQGVLGHAFLYTISKAGNWFFFALTICFFYLVVVNSGSVIFACGLLLLLAMSMFFVGMHDFSKLSSDDKQAFAEHMKHLGLPGVLGTGTAWLFGPFLRAVAALILAMWSTEPTSTSLVRVCCALFATLLAVSILSSLVKEIFTSWLGGIGLAVLAVLIGTFGLSFADVWLSSRLLVSLQELEPLRSTMSLIITAYTWVTVSISILTIVCFWQLLKCLTQRAMGKKLVQWGRFGRPILDKLNLRDQERIENILDSKVASFIASFAVLAVLTQLEAQFKHRVVEMFDFSLTHFGLHANDKENPFIHLDDTTSEYPRLDHRLCNAVPSLAMIRVIDDDKVISAIRRSTQNAYGSFWDYDVGPCELEGSTNSKIE